MITYKDIQEANAAIQTMTIERKDKKTGKTTTKEYAEVNQRIKAFRMVHPNGSIQTEIVSLQNGIVTMQSRIFNEEGVVIGTGYAQEKEESSFINQTSYIENCETSAVGRALGMCGFGIDTSVASYEEVQNAMANQDKAAGNTKAEPQANAQPLATEKQIWLLEDLYADEEMDAMLKRLNLKSMQELTIEQASTMIKKRKGK